MLRIVINIIKYFHGMKKDTSHENTKTLYEQRLQKLAKEVISLGSPENPYSEIEYETDGLHSTFKTVKKKNV